MQYVSAVYRHWSRYAGERVLDNGEESCSGLVCAYNRLLTHTRPRLQYMLRWIQPLICPLGAAMSNWTGAIVLCRSWMYLHTHTVTQREGFWGGTAGNTWSPFLCFHCPSCTVQYYIQPLGAHLYSTDSTIFRNTSEDMGKGGAKLRCHELVQA